MTDFLNEFVLYFFPNISNYPDWLEVVIGVVVLCFFFNVFIALINRIGGRQL